MAFATLEVIGGRPRQCKAGRVAVVGQLIHTRDATALTPTGDFLALVARAVALQSLVWPRRSGRRAYAGAATERLRSALLLGSLRRGRTWFAQSRDRDSLTRRGWRLTAQSIALAEAVGRHLACLDNPMSTRCESLIAARISPAGGPGHQADAIGGWYSHRSMIGRQRASTRSALCGVMLRVSG